MAKVNVVGDAVVVKSDLTMEEISMVKKYRPEALVLKGGEDGKEAIFRIDTTDRGHGQISTYGAEFAGASRDDEKRAILTMVAENMEGEPKEWVADKIGGALVKLNELEAKLPDVIEEITDERQKIMSDIEVG